MQFSSKTISLLVIFLLSSSGPSNCIHDLIAHPNLPLLPIHACGQIVPTFRITRGKKVTESELPWMAMLIMKLRENKLRFICGGSLINEKYILTAAHCVGRTFPHLVRLGDITTSKIIDSKVYSSPEKTGLTSQELEVEEIIPHPDYNIESKQKNDIALLRLSKKADIKSGAVSPICLPFFEDSNDLTGKWASVAGWGKTETGKLSSHLLRTSVLLRDISDCKVSHDGLICAGGEQDGADTCRGDSGGPMMLDSMREGRLRTVQIGISSYGDILCGTPGYPAAYTNVTCYLKWILDNIKP